MEILVALVVMALLLVVAERLTKCGRSAEDALDDSAPEDAVPGSGL